MTSSFVSICSWKVGGLFSKTLNKVNDSNFCKELLSHDIVFFLKHTQAMKLGFYSKVFNTFQYVDLYHQITDTIGDWLY